jgi:hypothetical protein
MASRYYGANVGAMQPTDVSESASTTSRAVEIQIDLTKTTSRIAVLQALEALTNYLRVVETDPIG